MASSIGANAIRPPYSRSRLTGSLSSLLVGKRRTPYHPQRYRQCLLATPTKIFDGPNQMSRARQGICIDMRALFGYLSAQMGTPSNPVNRILGVVLAYLVIASFCLISRPVYAEDRPASEYLKLSAQSSPPEVHPKWVKMFVSNTNSGRRIEATLDVNVEHYAPHIIAS